MGTTLSVPNIIEVEEVPGHDQAAVAAGEARCRAYIVTKADAAAIREVYERDGELSAAIELRCRFPGITDNAKAREQARVIAGWQPLPSRPQRPPKRSRKEKADTPEADL